ncbi:RidA family protein [Arenibacter lacus]|uniref:RidA family protein n=1 Tax=Arenibacter lacus TaxID=2608629 RepID=UPI001CC3D7C1
MPNKHKGYPGKFRSHYDDVLKINIQLKNIADLNAVNEVYTTYYKSNLPARTVAGVSAIPMDALVQIDATELLCVINVFTISIAPLIFGPLPIQ